MEGDAEGFRKTTFISKVDPRQGEKERRKGAENENFINH
jgi:hypothetical protein